MSANRIKDKRMVAFAKSRFSWKHQVVVVLWRLENRVVTFIELYLLHLETDTKSREENSALYGWISIFVCLFFVLFCFCFSHKNAMAQIQSLLLQRAVTYSMRYYFCPVSGTPVHSPVLISIHFSLQCTEWQGWRRKWSPVCTFLLSRGLPGEG